MKRILVVCVALLMLVASAGGCVVKNSGSPSAMPQASASSGESTPVAAKGEPVKLTSFGMDIDVSKIKPDDTILMIIKDKLNIELTMTSVPWDNYSDKLNLLLASGQTPSIWQGPGVDDLVVTNKLIKQGVLLCLDDYMSRYPNLAKALDVFAMYTKGTEGKNYCLPIKVFSQDVAAYNYAVFYVRKDYVDALGLSEPKTRDDFYNAVAALSQYDPDNSGKKIYGISSIGSLGSIDPIFYSFDVSPGLMGMSKQDGKYIPDVLKPEAKECIQFLKKLYDEQILDPDFLILNNEKCDEKFVQGKIAMFYRYMDNNDVSPIFDKLKKVYPDKDPMTLFTFWRDVPDNDGKYHRRGTPNHWWCTNISNQQTADQKEASVKLVDWVLTPEAIDLCRYGVQDVDYKVDGDKHVSLITEKDSNGNVMSFGMLHPTNFIKYMGGYDTEFLPDALPYRDVTVSIFSGSFENIVPNPLDGMYIPPDILPTETNNAANTYLSSMLTQFVVGKADINTWDDMINTWLSKGGQAIIDATNKIAAQEGR